MSVEDENEFVHTHTRAGGQDTSREAAAVAFTSSEHVKALIRGQLALGPRHDERLEDALAPIADSTVCARRADLVRDGEVTKLRDDDGKVVKARNRRGNLCIVWRLVEPDEEIAVESGRRAPKPTAEVVDAADRLGKWMRLTEGTGLLVLPPDYDDLRTVLSHIQQGAPVPA